VSTAVRLAPFNLPQIKAIADRDDMELMSTDELAVMDNGKYILQVQGVRPFFSDKFDITKHPQYKNLLDSSKKNAFDIKKYLS